jgi:hypothetical protein
MKLDTPFYTFYSVSTNSVAMSLNKDLPAKHCLECSFPIYSIRLHDASIQIQQINMAIPVEKKIIIFFNTLFKQ